MRWRIDIPKCSFGHRQEEGPFEMPFRLKDADGNIEFQGTCDNLANFSEPEGAFDPLDTLSDAYGVTTMEYYENGRWRVL